MSTPSTRLGLPIPEGRDNHNLENFQNLIKNIDAKVAGKAEVTAQLAHKPNYQEARLKTEKITQSDVSLELLNQITGNAPVNSIPANRSVGVEQFTDELQRTIKFTSFEWELGTIQIIDGVKINNTKRVRTRKVVPFSGGDVITITDAKYGYRPFLYDSTGKFLETKDQWQNGSYMVPYDCYIGITIIQMDEIELVDIVDSVGSKIYALKPSLPFDEINQHIEKVVYDVAKIHEDNYKQSFVLLTWTSEYVNGGTLQVDYSTDVILSNVVEVHKRARIELKNPGYIYKIAFCDSNGNVTLLQSEYTDQPTVFDEDRFIRIQFRKADMTSTQPHLGMNISLFDRVPKTDVIKQPIPIKDYYMNGIGYFPSIWGEGSLETFYSKWDKLLEENPNYITKTLLTTDSTGLPIYRYDFKSFQPQRQILSLPDAKLPKVIYFGSIHGNERSSHYLDLRFFTDLVNNWKSNDVLQMLRFNIHFIVIPVLCPWGFKNGTRTNANGVNLNRNFPTNWVKTEEGLNYSGLEPLSEVESQVAHNLLMENQDVLFVIDSHNTEPVQPANVLGYIHLTDGRLQLNEVLSSAIRTIDGWTREKYPLIEQEYNHFATNNLFSIGQTKFTGSLIKHFSTIGVNGVISEKADSWGYVNSYGKEELQDIGVDFIGNMIQSVVINSNLLI